MNIKPNTPVTLELKHLVLGVAILLGGGNLDSVAAIAGYGPLDGGEVIDHLNSEDAGFSRVQEDFIKKNCGFPGPIRDPEPEPRPEPPR